MKKATFISLTLSMLITFAANAQEKSVSKEHSEKKTTETTTKSKDTISDIKISSNVIKPVTSPAQIIICAPSKSSLMNEPLYILDGVVINSKQFSKVNPNDIESIQVLKGIDATSVYGNKAINGAIVITTKKED